MIYAYGQDDCNCTAVISAPSGTGTVGSFTQHSLNKGTPPNADYYITYIWTAIASTALTGKSISVTWSGTGSSGEPNHLDVIAITGADNLSPFDPGATPCYAIGANHIASCLISSSQPPDLIIGTVQSECVSTGGSACGTANYVPDTGFSSSTEFVGSASAGDGSGLEYNDYLTSQTNLNVTWGFVYNPLMTGWSMNVDAIHAGGIGLTPSVNNAAGDTVSQTATFTPSPNADIGVTLPAPPMLETGSIGGSVNGSFNVYFTTYSAPDLLYIWAQNDCICTAALSSSGFSFLQHSLNQGTNPTTSEPSTSYVWWAVANSILSSQVITVTWSGTGSSGSANHITVFAITNANLNQPFDPNTSVPAYSLGQASNGHSVISTSQPNDLLLADGQVECNHTHDCDPSNFTPVTSSLTGGILIHYATSTDAHVSSWLTVTSRQSSFNATINWPNVRVAQWTFNVDAIQGAAQVVFSPTLTGFIGALVTIPATILFAPAVQEAIGVMFSNTTSFVPAAVGVAIGAMTDNTITFTPSPVGVNIGGVSLASTVDFTAQMFADVSSVLLKVLVTFFPNTMGCQGPAFCFGGTGGNGTTTTTTTTTTISGSGPSVDWSWLLLMGVLAIVVFMAFGVVRRRR